MNKKALTAAIAASLAAPMAAQAVDFSISGHVNRGLFITDTDDSSEITIENNTSSATRIRATGSGKLDTGHTAGIQLEYQEGTVVTGVNTNDDGTYKSAKTSGGLTLRHANVWFSGDFGKVTLGQGSEAGDGSAYSDKTGLFGIGHGQDMAQSTLGSYFPSLDAGGRTDMIRYDTPALGPVNIAVSGAKDDQYSARARVDMNAMNADIRVQLAYLRDDLATKDETTGLSFGMKHDSGLTWSAAWAKMEPGEGPSAKDADIKPTYFQSTVGYVFGNNAVGLSWYDGKETANHSEAEVTAIGVGFIHKMPKAGVELYAAAQNYDVSDAWRLSMDPAAEPAPDIDETVAVIGARVKF